MTYQPRPNQNATAVYEIDIGSTHFRELCPKHNTPAKLGIVALSMKRVAPLGPHQERQCWGCFRDDNPGELP